jgi:hypothetical protein
VELQFEPLQNPPTAPAPPKLTQLGSLGSVVSAVAGVVTVVSNWAGIQPWLRWALLGITICFGVLGATLPLVIWLRARAKRSRDDRRAKRASETIDNALRALQRLDGERLGLKSERRGHISNYLTQLGNVHGNGGTIATEPALFYARRDHALVLCRIIGNLDAENSQNGYLCMELTRETVRAIADFVAALGKQTTQPWARYLTELVEATNEFMTAHNQAIEAQGTILGPAILDHWRFYPDQRVRLPGS